MNRYKWATTVFRAWSEMQCPEAGNSSKHTKNKDHMPHTWKSEYTVYGPYMCWGWPKRRDAEDVTREDLRYLVSKLVPSFTSLRPFFPDASKEARAIDKLIQFSREEGA
jgi:hypothetical protein